jgi:hypothetical protein
MSITNMARSLCVLVLTYAGVAAAQAPTLVGAWTRLSLRDSTGQALQPPEAPAFVIFSANGFFSQSNLPAGRPKTGKPLEEMTKEELLQLFRYVDAWRGTYSLAGTTLTRKTVAALDPSGEGGELVQVVRFAADTLILTRSNTANKSEARFVRAR